MLSISKLIAKKGKEKISMLTCYDFPTAKILEEAGIDIILVGDSLGTAIMGYKNTLPVTMEEVLHHSKAVRLGAPNTFVIGDMPFLSYGASIEQSVVNASRFLKETGMNAVKLEGGKDFADTVSAMVKVGIPVMGHIGLRPQSVMKSGLRIAGKTDSETQSLIEDAKALESAGAFSIVLEGTTEEAAAEVTRSISIPTIGIGAGKHTDGQVLVITDMLGFDKDIQFKHNKKFADLHRVIKKAVKTYISDVLNNEFPGDEQTFHK